MISLYSNESRVPTPTQARYAAGVREILECYLDGRPIRKDYEIVTGGELAGAGAHAYTKGNVTGGSDAAVGRVH